MKRNLLMLGLCLALAAAGCGKQSPVAPSPSQPGGGSLVKPQDLTPTDVAYTGIFSGNAGVKPWYWFDADNTPAFNATIRTAENGESALITRVNAGTWGKVHTAAITCAANYHHLRIFVPSHSGSTTWKIVIQEEGGQWRNWVLQDSTGYTGYKDYDFTAILNDVIAGSGSFTVNLVVEGGVGEYIEVTELYVFAEVTPENANNAYWEEAFPYHADYPHPTGHTSGWFDETTNPGFGAAMTNLGIGSGKFTTTASWGKVLSPVITCDTSVFKKLSFWMLTPENYSAFYRIGIQEQGGEYRHWWVSPLTLFPSPSYGFQKYSWDISGLGIAPDMPFSVEIVVDSPSTEMYFSSIGIYKE